MECAHIQIRRDFIASDEIKSFKADNFGVTLRELRYIVKYFYTEPGKREVKEVRKSQKEVEHYYKTY